MHRDVRERKITGTGGKDKGRRDGDFGARAARSVPRSLRTVRKERFRLKSVSTYRLDQPSTLMTEFVQGND